jgi:hypothetical protein
MGKDINEFYSFGGIPADRIELYATIAVLLCFAALSAVLVLRERRRQ